MVLVLNKQFLSLKILKSHMLFQNFLKISLVEDTKFTPISSNRNSLMRAGKMPANVWLQMRRLLNDIRSSGR